MKFSIVLFLITISTLTWGQVATTEDYLESVYNDILQLKKTNQRQEALYKTSLTIQQYPERGAFYNLKAILVLAGGSINNKKNDKAAILLLDSAILYAPDAASYYNNRGWIHQIMDHYKLAKKDFDKAVELEPTRVEYQHNPLRLLFIQNKNKAAMVLCNILIDKFPKDGYAYHVRGELKRDYLHKYIEGNKDKKRAKELGWNGGIYLRY